MVKLQEVEDEHFTEEQQGPKVEEEEDDADYTDTDSEISDDEDDESLEETIFERISALKDMVPPKQRAAISSTFDATSSFISWGLRLGGKSLWVLSTSAIMLGVPYALAVGEEQQMVEMEKEMKAQQLANNSLQSNGQNVLGEPQKA